eukprot:Skav203800  [mRNA]  locus=scaffold206:647143:652787:+ [translate_table: standard]
MEGNNSSWLGDEAIPTGESGGSADLPQTAEVSDVAAFDSPDSAFADFGEEEPVRVTETAEATIPSMGATSSPRSAREEVGESGGSASLLQDTNVHSMGATDSARSARDGFEVGESGGSSHLQPNANLASTEGNTNSWFGEDAFQAGGSGGSADLPQTAEVSNVAGFDSPGSAFADFGEEEPVRVMETAEATIPSMGATSSPRSAREEVGESGGSASWLQDINVHSMGATDSPRSARDGFEVGESGGSSHLQPNANVASTEGNANSWFGEDAFQAGGSGGSADIPQTAEVSNVAGFDSPDSAFADFGEEEPVRVTETAEATIPSMGATSSPRSAREEVGESGGSASLLQDINVHSMGATDSPRSARDGFEVGESGGSSHLQQDANVASTEGNANSWFGEDAFQAGGSGGSADLPQTAEVSNVAGFDSPDSAFADFGEEEPVRVTETAEATIPSMGATSSPRSAREEVGESGGSASLLQDINVHSMGATDSPRSARDGFEVGESGGSSHLQQDANVASTEGNANSWFGEDAFQAGGSGGSADIPQTAEVSNVAGFDSPDSAFADFGEEEPVRVTETAEATIPSMGATSSPRSAREEVGESGGSAGLLQDINVHSMGATDSPRSARDGFEVGESGGSSHLQQDANVASTEGNANSWFGEDAFQAGGSGGSADLPQTAEVSNVAGFDSPGSAFADFGEEEPVRVTETAEATIPSMGATSSPRSAREEVGESGGSAGLLQDINVHSMGATDSPRSARDGFEVGESGGSSHLQQDANVASTEGNANSWFGEDAFQAGGSGGSADLPQTAEVSNVAGFDSPGFAFADFGDDQPEIAGEAPATIPTMGATSSPRSGGGEVGESGGSAHLPQDVSSQPGDLGGPPSEHVASRAVATSQDTRGDIGGDDPNGSLERSFPAPATSNWGYPSGSGGSGGSGDRPSGYPVALDPGGTDEAEPSGDEQGIQEQAIPTGTKCFVFLPLKYPQVWSFYELPRGTTWRYIEAEKRLPGSRMAFENDDDDWEFGAVASASPASAEDHNQTVQKLVDQWMEAIGHCTGAPDSSSGRGVDEDLPVTDWNSWLRSSGVPEEAQELMAGHAVSNSPSATASPVATEVSAPVAQPVVAPAAATGSMMDADWGLLETAAWQWNTWDC